jgi:hypothetical protein
MYLLVIIFMGTACVDMNENFNTINEIIPSNSILHVDGEDND